jgi:hypothetical protein
VAFTAGPRALSTTRMTAYEIGRSNDVWRAFSPPCQTTMATFGWAWRTPVLGSGSATKTCLRSRAARCHRRNGRPTRLAAPSRQGDNHVWPQTPEL